VVVGLDGFEQYCLVGYIYHLDMLSYVLLLRLHSHLKQSLETEESKTVIKYVSPLGTSPQQRTALVSFACQCLGTHLIQHKMQLTGA